MLNPKAFGTVILPADSVSHFEPSVSEELKSYLKDRDVCFA
jgi:hypothetical protein